MKALELTKAENRAANTKKSAAAKLEAVISSIPGANMEAVICAAKEAHGGLIAASGAFDKIPKDRKELAKSTISQAVAIGKRAAHLGGDYSGDTSYSVQWGAAAGASTETGRGDQYSRSCKHFKTDAYHTVWICPAGVIELVENESLRESSARDGLPLIDLRGDGSAVWVRNKGKAIVAESGWIAGNARCCYHSTKSASDAQAGFERKLAKLEKEQKLARAAGKIDRRARLIARLCGGAIATVADAKRLGFCDPGISAFQSAHGIGDSCSLPQLVRTGNASAMRLALAVARKAATKKELA